jgi:tetratricopeptide (TPR) repeat protein
VRRVAAAPAFDAALETCARCHSRRGWIWEQVRPGAPIADSHRVALLDPGLYYDDGQIREEVYEYGSFLQSRMHGAGVTCADCHEPHSGKVRAAGNLLCGQWHLPSHYDAPAHHHHPAGSTGSACVNCHMPQRPYMIVDPRRDHSLRVPRPDLDASTGAPDACTACHTNRDAGWAAAAVKRWYPSGRSGTPHYGQALHAARSGAPDATAPLLALLADAGQPEIVRATALAALSPRDAAMPEGRDREAIVAAIGAAARDRSDLVRRAAAEWVDALPPEVAARLGAPLLADPIRTVRLAAAASLAGAPATAMGPDAPAALARGVEEYRRALAFNADRADSQFNLGNLERQLGRTAEAETAYRRALALDPTFIPAAVNLADLCAATGRDPEGESALKSALARNPDSADLEYALGLACIRRKDAGAGLPHLQRAAALRPDEARYAFVHAVAVHDLGDAAGAIRLLESAAARHPNDADIAGALLAYYTERGDAGNAGRWDARLKALGGR